MTNKKTETNSLATRIKRKDAENSVVRPGMQKDSYQILLPTPKPK
jgi:hypothetical protein